jgi:hypothetical protein
MYATNKKFALLLQAFINTVNKISGKFLLKLTAFFTPKLDGYTSVCHDEQEVAK